MSFISVMIFCYILTSAIKHHYTYNLIVYIEKSIDIVAPKINEQQRLELKAKYRLIDNYDKFKIFNEELNNVANEKGIELPPFKFILK